MALQKVVIKPGVNADFTPTLNEGGWSASNLIRFKDGLAQKLGGWQKLAPGIPPFSGSVRGVHSWSDLSGNAYYAAGSEQRLQVFTNGQNVDITPLRQTDNVTPSLTTNTTSGTQNLVTITDVGHGAADGDWVTVVFPISAGPASSGNPILWGPYRITGTTGNTYRVAATSNATSVVANTGAVPLFTTASGQTYVKVTLNNHGYTTGLPDAGYFNVQASTTVAGIPMLGTFVVTTSGLGGASDLNNFYIVPGPVATTNASGSENAGNARYLYAITAGYASGTYLAGYGYGPYNAGSGASGYGQTTATGGLVPARTWYLDNFGQNLVGNYNGSTLYQWVPPVTTYAGLTVASNPATGVANAPTGVNISFVSNPQQMVICGGVWNAGTGGAIDPNLVAWCDAGGITTWTASSSNQAGTFRIPTGSKIVGGMVMPNQNLIWTDLDLWAMQYLGLPFVWGFTKISTECGLISGHAMGVLVQKAFWMGTSNFFTLGPGGAQVLPCPVWDVVYKNLNVTQSSKIFCAINSYFQEAMWFYPSLGSDEINSYVKFNATENAWDYGSLVRLSWADEGAFGAPIAIDASGVMLQHETSPDADGVPMLESIDSGYFDVGDGEMFVYVERIIPDFKLTQTMAGTTALTITVKFLEYPFDANIGAGPVVCGPFNVTSSTEMIVVRCRGRQASISIQGVGIGNFWRIGALRHNGQPDGRR